MGHFVEMIEELYRLMEQQRESRLVEEVQRLNQQLRKIRLLYRSPTPKSPEIRTLELAYLTQLRLHLEAAKESGNPPQV